MKSLFLLIPLFYLSLNYYIFSRANTLFSLNFGLKFKLLGVALGLFSLIFMIWHTHTYKMLYYFSIVWVGIAFIASAILLLEHILHNFLPFKQNHIAVFTFALILVLVAYSLLNGIFSMTVKKVEIETDKISQNQRAVLIADTHIHRFHSKKHSEKLVKRIMQQQPNFVLISGDFVENRIDRKIIEPFENLEIPVFLVLGNHEFYVNGNKAITNLFEQSKINLVQLGDEFLHGQFSIRGAEYNHVNPFVASSEFRQMELDTSRYNIFLFHEPIFMDDLEQKGFDLVLSGHTHNGQIVPFNLFVKLAYKYTKGLYDKGKTKIYVSQGTGTWGPPMRLGTTNEITVIDFVRE